MHHYFPRMISLFITSPDQENNLCVFSYRLTLSKVMHYMCIFNAAEIHLPPRRTTCPLTRTRACTVPAEDCMKSATLSGNGLGSRSHRQPCHVDLGAEIHHGHFHSHLRQRYTSLPKSITSWEHFPLQQHCIYTIHLYNV
jgi:hypothetical protein